MSEATKSTMGFKRPEFTTALRGYDRLHVDEYIERLHALVVEAEERARAAEEDLEYSQHTAVGPRVTEIFDIAVEEAKQLRDKAETESAETLADSQAEAEELIEAARRQYADMQEQTERDRERGLREMARQTRKAQSELKELASRKAALLAELRRLHEALAAAAGLGVSGDGVAGDGEAGAADTDSQPTRETPIADTEEDAAAA
jgi:cell division septum initiation protein DivIVA